MEHNKPEITYILLAICTYKRPNMLKNAINSVNGLQIPDNIRTEVLIVDNDKEKSAFETIQELQKTIKLKINYISEEKRGLASARNRVLEEGISRNASHIFMFDDDEILTPTALEAHINLYRNDSNCLISSGIVLNKFSPDTPKYIQKNIVFKHRTTRKTGQIKSSCASGNVFIPVELTKSGLRFSEEFLLMGGEDGDFFSRASKEGWTIVQNTDSLIYEDVSKERSTIKYILKRAYYNGYSSSYLKFKESKKHGFSYILKLLFVLFADIIILIPSLFFGLSVFFNVLSMSTKTLGKTQGILKNSPMEFYSKVYGN